MERKAADDIESTVTDLPSSSIVLHATIGCSAVSARCVPGISHTASTHLRINDVCLD
jgi:hypothetical protein